MSSSVNAQYKPRVLREGFVEKKSRVLKKWRKRYFKLNGEVLCFFKKEDQTEKSRPMGRIFLADVVSVGQYFSKAKTKDNCFSLDTKSGKTHIMNCETKEERDAWIVIINFAREEFFKQEETDPVRRRSIRLQGDLKRIKLFKDPMKGIGVRIKSVNGCVFVTRIVEDGPVAETGVLRPGDQIIDVGGVNVGNMTIQEVSEVLKEAPILMSCTVKPANHFRYCQNENEQQPNTTSYAEIDIDALVASTLAQSGTEANYEDDQSSEGSTNYVTPIASDDELENGAHVYEKPVPPKPPRKDREQNDNGGPTYMNMPKGDENVQISPQKRNYLELTFEVEEQ